MLVSALKSTSRHLHAAVGTSKWLTSLYLESLGSISRSVFPRPLSERVLNSVRAAPFREVLLAPRSVRLGSCTSAWLQPHLGEFDLEALFFRALPYEHDTMAFIASRMSGYEFVLEIGANVGVYTLLFAALLKQHGKSTPTVYCFEPSREAYHRLQVNLRLNGLGESVEPYQAAVSSETGLATFFEPDGHLTNGSLKRDFATQFTSEVRSNPVITVGGEQIERLLAERPGAFLIKIDVEGGEQEVLDALASVIRGRRPDILIEVLPDSVDALDRHPALRGYKRFELGPEGARERPVMHAASNRDWFLRPEGE